MDKFNTKEYKFLAGISSAVGLRQLGLLLVIPFISIYGEKLTGSTPGLIGISLGIYGLMQAFLQLPYGMVSDRIGRKPVVVVSMALFALGFVLASFVRNIYMFIVARALQGSGAITAVIYAWVGDEISTGKRNRAMSVIGMVMGVSAVAAFIIGPFLYDLLDMPGLFLICAGLTGMALIYISIFLSWDKPGEKTDLSIFNFRLLKNKNLMILFTGAFLMNYLLVSFFFIVPKIIIGTLGSGELWKVFVPATLLGIVVMKLGVNIADKGKLIYVLTFSFLLTLVGSFFIYLNSSFYAGASMFFLIPGYMLLATLLPSAVTKMAEKNIRGAVTGVFNTFQFVGSFLGGTATGFLWGWEPVYSSVVLIIMAALGSILVIGIDTSLLKKSKPRTA